MLDAPYQKPDKSAFDIDRMGVKASQFSFARLQNADPVLGVDMSSTGEVGCMGDTFEEALLNSLIATGYKIPSKDKGIMLSSGGAKGEGFSARCCTGAGEERLHHLCYSRYSEVPQREQREGYSRRMA